MKTLNKISDFLYEINKVVLTENMKDYACHIDVLNQDHGKMHIQYFGFDGCLENTWVFSRGVIGIEDAIKEVLTFKYHEIQDELKEEIAKGYEAEPEELCTLKEWFKKWGI